jgi:peptidoglycan/xylan/chitin deacetylase (PgdA/CDA1 family)
MEPRPYGPFPFRPITKHLGLKWPGNTRLAFIILPAVEFFPLNSGIPRGSGAIPDAPAWGRREYGNRVGIFRIGKILKSFGIRGSVGLNSMVCDFCPEVVEYCLELDWELVAHAETNAVRLYDFNTEEEAEECIRRSLDRIEKFSGRRPKGWIGAGRQQTWNTLNVIAEEGCTYTFDWDNDDQPVAMEIDDKIVVSMPYGAGVSDHQAFHSGSTSADFEQMIKDAFDVLYQESKESGRVYTISLHPYIVGLPHRIGSIERSLEYICKHEGVWFATSEEVTNSFLSQTDGLSV